MKLDLSAIKYLSPDDFRVLTAIELGMRNHEIVPINLIDSLAKLKKGNSFRVIQNLLKHKLVEHSNLKYDGYVLNFIGYDYLAIHTLMKRGVLVKIGPKIGVGKESDVFICYVNPNAGIDTEVSEEELYKLRQQMLIVDEEENEEEEEEEEEENNDEENNDLNSKANANIESNKIETVNDKNKGDEFINEMFTKFEEELEILGVSCHIAVLKLARLGRTSFRAVKTKRDYVKYKSHYNWIYLSRLSAINEFKFLKALYQTGFPVPKPYDQNRHAILMQYIPSFPLCRIEDLGDKEKAYNDLTSCIVKMASKGLIHGDFNEFNILVNIKDQKMFIIDFPQMVSIEHEEAEMFFNRDIQCINKFFKKKFGITFNNSDKILSEIKREDFMDVKLKAYGYETVVNRLKKENNKEIDNNDLGLEIEAIEADDLSFEDINDEDIKELNLGIEDLESKEQKNIKNNKVNDKEEPVLNTNNIVKAPKINVKDKVKRLIEKSNKQKGKSSNRFKGKKKIANNDM